MEKIGVVVKCRKCKKITEIKVYPKDVDRYNSGEGLIQDIFPYLDADMRELIKDEKCGSCFDKEMRRFKED